MKLLSTPRSRGRRNLLATAGSALLGAVALRPRNAAADVNPEPIRQPETPTPNEFIRRAFDMRDLASANGDQGYGALIVNGSGEIVGEAPSRVVTNGDPTAHAEMEAIRHAAHRLGTRESLRAHHVFLVPPLPDVRGRRLLGRRLETDLRAGR